MSAFENTFRIIKLQVERMLEVWLSSFSQKLSDTQPGSNSNNVARALSIHFFDSKIKIQDSLLLSSLFEFLWEESENLSFWATAFPVTLLNARSPTALVRLRILSFHPGNCKYRM